MTVNDIIAVLEEWAPHRLCDDGDNSGLLVGRRGQDVKRVFVTLDVDSATLAEAIRVGADLIVCHHPLMYKCAFKAVTDENFEANLVMQIIENNMSMFAMHTNLDWADGGVNDVLCERLGLREVQPLLVNEKGAKVGRIGVADKTLGEFVRSAAQKLGACVRYVGEDATPLSKVAVCGGGGGFLLETAAEAGCDALLAADFPYHMARKAREMGFVIIDAGHFETENVIVEAIADFVKMRYNNIDVVVTKRMESYWKYL